MKSTFRDNPYRPLAQCLRALPLLRGPAYRFWKRYARRHPLETFLFRTSFRGRPLVYGGVFTISDEAFITELDRYESSAIHVLDRVLREEPRPVVLDVGANNGQYLAIVKCLKPDAEIHSFEPYPELADFLALLAEVNEFSGVRINECVLGDRRGFAGLYFKEGETIAASTVRGFQPSFFQYLKARQIRLDDYAAEHSLSRMDFLKIDVEGGEHEVLYGAVASLRRWHPPILLELLYTQKPDHAKRQNEVIALLKELGYQFWQIAAGGKLVFQDPVSPDPDYRCVNYLVTTAPREEVDRL